MKHSLLTIFAATLCGTILPAQNLKGFTFEIETLGGQRRTQEDYKNNLVIIDFWGTWCGPCKQAVPGLVNLYKKYKHHGLEIIGLNYKERGNKAAQMATVRKFAERYGITYTLALGTEKIRKQVIGFSGYPTMILFNKGMKYHDVEVGFDPGHKAEFEKWIRGQLGLEGEATPAKPKETVEKEKVPAGVIYRPGKNDTGFEFAVKGLDGKEIKFADFRGKKVVLALTSTWDGEAANTAALLEELHGMYSGKGVAVIAASMEESRLFDKKVAAIQAFQAKNKVSYTVLPVGLPFLKKIHEPSGIPLFLVFDAKGTLILRRKNSTKAEILKAIGQALAG